MPGDESRGILTQRSLRVLEFDRIRERLAAHALTPMGAQRCLELQPSGRLPQAEHAQEETREALSVLARLSSHPLSAFRDVRPELDQAQKGSVLSPRVLLDVAACLAVSATARAALSGDEKDLPVLQSLASALFVHRALEREIRDAILSEDEIADDASVELKDIRRHIRQLNDRIRDRLQSMVQNPSSVRYLQEAIVTIRNGRYVVPVRVEHRQSVPGLVHDQSSSGATLFIEPSAVVEAGNELRIWQGKEEREIERILRALSGSVAAIADDLSVSVGVLVSLDAVFARARLAQEMDAVRPQLNEGRLLKLKRARHPLIDRETVVPCNLWLGEDFTALVVTGPNTGGKTVTLKTVGLLSVMAQSGLHLPCDPGTEVPVFGNIWADIGDEQSIEQSLSTFSSHMVNIVGIINNAGPRDLVLLDELGAGTDPAEGAALAQALLSYLVENGILTVATTHYSELKAFALSTPGVENASMEFDVSTLRPTYRLSIGIPGKSNAFEISARLGLRRDLIDRARSLMSGESLRFEDVIANAEYHRRIAEKERLSAEAAHRESQEIHKKAEQHLREAEARKAGAEREARAEARRVLENTRRESARILEELRQLKKTAAAGGSALSSLKSLRELEDSLQEGLAPVPGAPSSQEEGPPDVGDEVLVLDLNTRGTVLQAADSRGEVLVLVGAMRMSVNASRLRRLSKSPAPSRSRVQAPVFQPEPGGIGLECDVRGLSLDEAILQVDRYLDGVLRAGLQEVSIIHGKGTGTLRAGIQKHLKKSPQVRQLRSGRYGEGEDGVTVVSLR